MLKGKNPRSYAFTPPITTLLIKPRVQLAQCAFPWASLFLSLLALQKMQCRRPKFDPWVGKILWRREWLLTPVFLPGESRQRSLVGYSPWGRKESDTTEQLSLTITKGGVQMKRSSPILSHVPQTLYLAPLTQQPRCKAVA